jgi:hypothetical protein
MGRYVAPKRAIALVVALALVSACTSHTTGGSTPPTPGAEAGRAMSASQLSASFAAAGIATVADGAQPRRSDPSPAKPYSP